MATTLDPTAQEQLDKARALFLSTHGGVPAAAFAYGENYFLKALLVGDGGSGKTRGALTVPGKKLHIDTDGSKEVLLGMQDVDTIPIREPDPKSPQAYSALEKLTREIDALIKQGKFPYDAIIADSVTRIYAISMNYAKLLDPARNKGDSPVTTHWMIQKDKAMSFIEWGLHLPIHFICTVHEEAEKDELLGTVQILPAVTGKDARGLSPRFREVYHCFTKEEELKVQGETVRGAKFYWRTQPEPQRPYLKSSMNTMGQYWGPIVEPSFEQLLKKRGILP